MRDRPDATSLLRDLADAYDADAFHPDAPVARASLERIIATPEPDGVLYTLAHRERPPGGLCVAAG